MSIALGVSSAFQFAGFIMFALNRPNFGTRSGEKTSS